MSALEQRLALPVSTTFDIAHRTIERHIGPAFGIVAWSAGAAVGVKALGRQLKRGELAEITESISEAREIAVQRLVAHAQAQGADAVVGMSFDSNGIGDAAGLMEILALGTAVKLAD